MNPLIWICVDCEQLLPRHDAPCDCPTVNTDRYLQSPYGAIPVSHTDLGASPVESKRVAA